MFGIAQTGRIFAQPRHRRAGVGGAEGEALA
jgi:hypothetical protein